MKKYMNTACCIVKTDTETNAMEVRPMESIIRRILIYSPNNSGFSWIPDIVIMLPEYKRYPIKCCYHKETVRRP